ncbi:hypothetical protein V6N11_020088 [Hibiscus sabdariffa]|uniref:Uncharacterized protein n=1 Tax=Hibiscus sabdariffa TaxID=183260 RepID=A0ABR2P8J7_9ROSI
MDICLLYPLIFPPSTPLDIVSTTSASGYFGDNSSMPSSKKSSFGDRSLEAYEVVSNIQVLGVIVPPQSFLFPSAPRNMEFGFLVVILAAISSIFDKVNTSPSVESITFVAMGPRLHSY